MGKNKLQSGQILLIVVVIMVVALTVALTLVSRTVINLKLSKQNENSQRAFQAASAGIEKTLLSAGGQSGSLDNNATYTTTISTAQGTQIALNNYSPVDQDRGMDVWLTNYPDYSGTKFNGNITFFWGGATNPLDCTTGKGKATAAALEIVLLSGTDINAPTLSKYVYDACSRGNNFTVPTGSVSVVNPGTINGQPFPWHFTTTIAITDGIIMKVIPLYNSTTIGVVASSNLPPQGKVITATGTSADTRRKILYFESYPQIPNEVFPYSILSQ